MSEARSGCSLLGRGPARADRIYGPLDRARPPRAGRGPAAPAYGVGVGVGAHELLPSAALLGDQAGPLQHRDVLLHRGEADRQREQAVFIHLAGPIAEADADVARRRAA